jgi:hypothetical protein
LGSRRRTHKRGRVLALKKEGAVVFSMNSAQTVPGPFNFGIARHISVLLTFVDSLPVEDYPNHHQALELAHWPSHPDKDHLQRERFARPR